MEIEHIGGIFPADEYWSGTYLYLPATGDQELLLRPSANTHFPNDGKSYPVVTKEGAAVRCVALATTSEAGSSGEGFEVVMPDGVVYTLNQMVSRIASTLKKSQAGPLLASAAGATGATDSTTATTLAPVGYILPRKEYFLYPTKVTDRFGNTVTYTWSSTNPWQLLQITASDGRQLTLGYSGSSMQASSVSDGTRTWTYTYAPPRGIDTVTLPDGTQWRFDLGDLALASPQPYGVDCDAMTVSGTYTGSIIAPTGATASFTLGAELMGRSWVPRQCLDPSGSPHALEPSLFMALALQDKTVTGPGLPAAGLTWTYSYGLPNQCWKPGGVPSGAIQCTTSSPTTRTVEVTDPDGIVTRHSFGNEYKVNEGLPLQVDYGWNGSTALRTVVTTYASQTAAPYAPFNGISVRNMGDYDITSRLRPVRQVTTTQQGVTFTWAVPAACTGVPYCFDAHARPTTMARSSTLGASRTEATTYYDHVGKWVMGQVTSVTCTATHNSPPVTECDGDDVMQQVTFDTTYALPLTQSAFGKLQNTFTWDTSATIASGQRGTLKTVKDGNNHATTFTSWKRGIPQSVQYADGTSQSALVNAQGWITAITDETGAPTGYGYDTMGRLASIIYPTGDTPAWNATTIVSAPVATAEHGIGTGHWRRTESTGNARKITYYDALWRPLLTREYDTASAASTSRYLASSFDSQGRVVHVAYPVATAPTSSGGLWPLTGTATTYDALGRTGTIKQDSELGLLTTAFAYQTGFKTRVTNPRGYATTTSYLAWDEPATGFPSAVVHPEGAYTDILRDAYGKPLQITRRNAASTSKVDRKYGYNTHQELCRQEEPETGATVMGYDAAGNLAWSATGLLGSTPCDAGGNTPEIDARKVVRTYDARNRAIGLAFTDGQADVAYSYNARGQLATITAYNGGSNLVTTSYTYNRRGLPTSEQLAWSTTLWTISYGYSANGHLSTLGYPGSVSVAYAPNALGQPTQAGSYATGVSYFPNGAMKQFTYGNGIVHTLAQNARGLPDRSIDGYGSTHILDDGYDYDKNGNVAAISDGATGRNQYGNRTMAYDGLDRLTAVQSPMYGSSGTAYQYDSLDNLVRVVAPGRDHYYCYDSNRLTNVRTGNCATGVGATVIGLGYDVQGNLANKNGVLYTFDHGNRLRNVSSPATSYFYDGHGRRVRDFTSGSRYSLYNASGELMYGNNVREGKQYWYVNLNGSLVGTREKVTASSAISTTYQHTDALGSPVAVTNASRVVLERNEYEPYGKLVNGPMQDGPGYTGHVMDAPTGLAYMQQRYYDPAIGRFLSVDPVGADSGAGFNRYAYVANNPYLYVDPDGRELRRTDNYCSNGVYQCASGPDAGSAPADSPDPAKPKGSGRITIEEGVDGNNHQYRITGAICASQSEGCNEDYADEVYAYVNSNDIPFTIFDNGSGERNLLWLVPHPLGNQPIFHIENPSGRTSVNIALDGHNFFPGSVVHRVHFAKGWLRYDVIGVGSGRNPNANNKVGIILFFPGVADVVTKFGR